MCLQIILIAVDTRRKLSGVLPGVVASELDVAIVESLKVDIEPALHLWTDRTFRVLGDEKAGALDLVVQRDVGQRFGMDQVLNDPAFGCRPLGGDLGLERPGE
jgi:hypothetical protein